MIAQEAGLIPNEFAVGALVTKLWEQSLQSESGPREAVKRAAERLLETLYAKKGGDIVDWTFRKVGTYREALGYFGVKHDNEDDKDARYVVRSSKLADLSGGIVEGSDLRRYLAETGVLIPAQNGKRTWSGYRELGKGTQYVVLKASAVEASAADTDMDTDAPPDTEADVGNLGTSGT